MITYAVVPTAGVPASQAQSLTNFLTNMVAFSSGKDGTLPGGYVPLPSDLVTAATQDIAADVKAAPAAPSGSTSGSTGSGQPTATSSSNGSGGGSVTPSDDSVAGESGSSGEVGSLDSTGTSLGTSPHTSSGSGSTTSTPAAVTPNGSSAARENVIDAGFDVIAGNARLLVPLLVAVALAGVIVGTVLLVWPRRRRRPAPAGQAGIDDLGGDDPGGVL
jgi:hypothetical protein